MAVRLVGSVFDGADYERITGLAGAEAVLDQHEVVSGVSGDHHKEEQQDSDEEAQGEEANRFEKRPRHTGLGLVVESAALAPLWLAGDPAAAFTRGEAVVKCGVAA